MNHTNHKSEVAITNNKESLPYTPSLDFFSSPGFYDFFLSFSRLGASFFRDKVLSECNLEENKNILDIGCGTATFLAIAKQKYPHLQVTGVDPDQELLDFAEAKFKSHNFQGIFTKGSAQSLPYSDGQFDVCVSSLVFHHLKPAVKNQAFEEMYRVLSPGGTAIIIDFKRIKRPFFAHFYLWDDYESLRANFEGQLEKLITNSQFSITKNIRRSSSLIEIYILKK